MNKKHFEAIAVKFEEVTGIHADYVKQRGNGSWLWLDTDDNEGEGYAIGVNGYVEAYNILFFMLDGYKLGKNGCIC